MRNLIKEIDEIKIKKPNRLIFNFASIVFYFMYKLRFNTKFIYTDDPRKEKSNFLLLGNHPSIYDFGNIMPGLFPKTFNIVGAYSNFFRFDYYYFFKIAKIIPKKRNCPDITSLMTIKRMAKKGSNIMIFPEGVSSINGANQPAMIGTAKLCKSLNIPVYVAISKYSQFSLPKYDETFRKGKVFLEFKKIFDVEELNKLSLEEIEDKINETLYIDPYETNKIDKIKFKPTKKHQINQNLEDLLYLCPSCNHEFTNFTHDNIIECKHCGNKVKMDNYYQIEPLEGSISPTSIKKWHDLERILIKEEIESNPNFNYEIEVKLGVLSETKLLRTRGEKTSINVGRGKVKVNRDGLFFEGTKNNEPFNFHLSSIELPTLVMSFDCNIVHLFYLNSLYEFKPLNKGEAVKLELIVEEMHRFNNGKWQNYKFFKYDKDECFK